MVYCYDCKKPSNTKYQCPLLKEKPARDAHVSATISDDEHLRHRFSSSRYPSINRTHKLNLPLSATLVQIGNHISCLTSFIPHTWIIDS